MKGLVERMAVVGGGGKMKGLAYKEEVLEVFDSDVPLMVSKSISV